MAPGALEQLLRGLAPRGSSDLEQRVIAGRARNEDAVVVRMPAGKAIVQTVDILAPIVNDAFWFGRIAACNALSDVYALGGQPWCAMNVAFFPTCLTENDPENILANILRGGMDALEEAGAVLAGGHTVQDDELKYGMAVTGVIDPEHVAANDKLRPGLRLLLTKPLGTGILATGVKARWDDHEESEALLQQAREDQMKILNEAAAAKERIISEAKGQAQAEAQKQLEEAKRQIRLEKEAAVREVRSQIAMLSVDIAEKVIRNKLDNTPAQMSMIDRLLEEMPDMKQS